MYQIYVEIWEATKSSRKVLIYRMYWQLKIYAWIFLITLGCYVVLNTICKGIVFDISDIIRYCNIF